MSPVQGRMPSSQTRWSASDRVPLVKGAGEATVEADLDGAPPRYSALRRAGNEAESRAAAHLEQAGWQVLARNVLYRDGELDLVVRKGVLVAFVEVRMRSLSIWGGPAETVTFAKQRRVVRAAMRWLQRERLNGRVEVRFDVIAVVGKGPTATLEHLEGAFDAGG